MNLSALAALQAQYKLEGRTVFQGLPISIENKRGSVRKGKCEKGKPHTCWRQRMTAHYGYLSKGMDGVDGDKLDVFIGPNANATTAYVVHTKKAPDFEQYDEDKCFLGWDSAAAAKKAFIENYGGDARHFGSMTAIPMQQFKDKVSDGKAKPQKLVAANLEKAMRALGEPGVYEGGAGHLESTPTFHPPSLKNAKRIPADDPGETDNRFLDVSKRSSKSTKKLRDERTRRVAIPAQLPGGSTAVQHHTAMYLPFVTNG